MRIRDTFELNPGLAKLFKRKILEIAREVHFPEDLIDFKTHMDMKGTYSDNLRIFYHEYPRLSERSDYLKKNPVQRLSEPQIQRSYRAYQISNGETPEPITPIIAIANTRETLTEPTIQEPTRPTYPTLSFSFNYATNSFPDSNPSEPITRSNLKPQREPEESEESVNVLDRIFPRLIPLSRQPGDNAVIQKHIIVYGRQGRGKTNTARWLVEEAKRRFNEKNVNVQVANGERFRDLLESNCWTNQLVQILVLENITNVSFNDADLRDFFRIREVMARRSQRSDGLVLCVFTVHRFYDTPKSFRSDYDALIALSAPSNDFDYHFLERKFGEEDMKYLANADESHVPEGKALILYRRTQKQKIQIPKIEPRNSFMVQMENYWKQETSPELGEVSKVSCGLNPDGECASRYKLRLASRSPSTRALGKATVQRRDCKPQQPKDENREHGVLAVILFLFSSLLLLATYPPQLASLALICLGYAGAFVMFARWVKEKCLL